VPPNCSSVRFPLFLAWPFGIPSFSLEFGLVPVDVPRLNFSRPPFLSFHAGLSNPAIHCSSGQQLPPARVLLWSLSPPNCCAPELLDEMLAIPSLSLSTSVVSVCCTCACACVTECYCKLPVCCSRHSEVSSNRGDRSFRDSEILQECETMSHRPLCTFWYFG